MPCPQASAGQASWDVDRLNDGHVRAIVSAIVLAQEELHQDVLQCVAAELERYRNPESDGVMGAFTIGDHVVVPGPRNMLKLVVTWAGL